MDTCKFKQSIELISSYVTDFPLCNRFLVSGYSGINGKRGGERVYSTKWGPLYSAVAGWDSI